MISKSEYAKNLLLSRIGIEIWKTVEEYPSYEVSNLGRIRRYWKGIGYRIVNGRLCGNYLCIGIGKKTAISIHRLVAKTFIPNYENKKTVDHIISKEKTNNKLYNLRWFTPKEQNSNRDTSNFGINNGIKIICMEKNTNKEIKKFNSMKEALQWLGKDHRCGSHITKVCRGELKSIYNYKWKYDIPIYKGEIWKDISELNNEYSISNYGRIYYKKKKIIKVGSKTSDGYLRFHVVSKKNNINYRELVHRVVAKYFIENPENKEQVNHKNMERSNCHVSNLEWVSCSENVLHSYLNRREFKV